MEDWRMLNSRTGKILISYSSIFLLLSSCSLFSTRDVVGVPGKEKKAERPAVVPKKQYDELLEKYQALLRRNRQLEGEELPQDVVGKSEEKLPKLAETVDVFTKQLEQAPESKTKNSKPSISPSFSSKDLSAQVGELKRVIQLINQNHLNEASQLLKGLENSRYRQIIVRVKFYMGEVLFRQGEFDLAMQMFEEVINRYAFSGIVLKTLGRLIVCSEKLKLKKKYDLYYSILHDFFKTV